MNTNDQVKTRVVMRLAQQALRRAGVAAVVVALGTASVSAQMAPPQPTPMPAPTPTPQAPAAQPASSANEATFKRIDADGDGFISRSELEKADANLGKDFDKYDTDKDGKLSMAEFDAMLKVLRTQGN